MSKFIRDHLLKILLAKSVKFGEFTLSSGAKSDFYVDCRTTTMDAVGAQAIGVLGVDIIVDFLHKMAIANGTITNGGGYADKMWIIDSIGGLTMGADPIAMAIAIESSKRPQQAIDAFSVRKETKDHGTKRKIEGSFQPGHKVVIVEDVVTTGGSAIQAIDAVEGGGGEVLFVLALVDREEGGRGKIEARGFPLLSITTKSELQHAYTVSNPG